MELPTSTFWRMRVPFSTSIQITFVVSSLPRNPVIRSYKICIDFLSNGSSISLILKLQLGRTQKQELKSQLSRFQVRVVDRKDMVHLYALGRLKRSDYKSIKSPSTMQKG